MRSFILRSPLYLLLALGLVSISCKPSEKQEGTGAAPATDAPETTPEKPVVVSVWDRIPVWSEADPKSKYVTAINIGEKMVYQGQEKKFGEGKNELTYLQVQLVGGKEGWIDSRFVLQNAKPAAVTANITLYERPELTAKTAKKFEPFDIIAISKASEGGWLEVKGKPRKEKWLSTGWIKNNGLSLEEKDLAVAAQAQRALALTDESKRKEELKKIVDDPDLQGSTYGEELSKLIGEAAEAAAEMPDSTQH